MNLTVRLFGRELLAIDARVAEPAEPQEPQQPGFSIGFAAAELAAELDPFNR